MIGGILLYTPYPRYWMPAYPLWTTACVLAGWVLVRDVAWRPRGFWVSAAVALILAWVALLPAPLLCKRVPWSEYTQKRSVEQVMNERFWGYPAVRQLNRILKPDDGVISDGFEGIYLIGGRPSSFGSGWSGAHRIHDLASFEDFCNRYNIRYWIYNHLSAMHHGLGSLEKAGAKYWTPDRTVAAWGTVMIYDLMEEHPGRWGGAKRSEIPPLLEDMKKPWTNSDAPVHWINYQQQEPAVVLPDGSIALRGRQQLRRRIQPEIVGGLCRVKLGIRSKERTNPAMELIWYDAKGTVLDRTAAFAYGEADYEAWYYATVPPKAKFGWLLLSEAKGQPMRLVRGEIVFWPAIAVTIR
jgi:hypothetical protein